MPDPFLLPLDVGLAFTSHRYTKLVGSHGLKQQFITPHSPEENAMMERLIRTLKGECNHRQRFETEQCASRAMDVRFQFHRGNRGVSRMACAGSSGSLRLK